jgi:hypothetical protein
MVPGCVFGEFFRIPSSDLSAAEAPLRMHKRRPLTRAGLHQVTIGSRRSFATARTLSAQHSALPNYSFKPTPLRSFTFAPALR